MSLYKLNEYVDPYKKSSKDLKLRDYYKSKNYSRKDSTQAAKDSVNAFRTNSYWITDKNIKGNLRGNSLLKATKFGKYYKY